jgi:hypothetical protein
MPAGVGSSALAMASNSSGKSAQARDDEEESRLREGEKLNQ